MEEQLEILMEEQSSADFKTKSIEQALEETARRRIKQIQFNKNNIKPKSTSRNIEESIEKEEK